MMSRKAEEITCALYGIGLGALFGSFGFVPDPMSVLPFYAPGDTWMYQRRRFGAGSVSANE
jgi:hypothetical protein